MNHPFIIALTRQGAYSLLAQGIIAACAIAHLLTIFAIINSASLFTAVMPVFGFTACLAYGFLCFATRKNSLLKVLFVVGAFSTFWIQ